MARKDKGTIDFHLDWWQFLRFKSPEVIAEVLTRFFEHVNGTRTFDTSAFATRKPTEVEELLIPMVDGYKLDARVYKVKCEKNRDNIKKRWNTTVYDRIQSNTTVFSEPSETPDTSLKNNLISTVIESNRDKDKESCFLFSSTHVRACEGEPDEKKQKKQLLFVSALYYLSEGHTKPMAEAKAAWDYNDKAGWMEYKRNGRDIDHSGDKEKWMRGWQCSKGTTISPVHGRAFAKAMWNMGWDDQTILDHFTGIRQEGREVFILFNSKSSVKLFIETLTNEENSAMLEGLYAALTESGLKTRGSKVIPQYEN